MAWRAIFRYRASSHRLDGQNVYLRPAQMEDFRSWAEVRASSRAFLQPWEPIWPADDLSRAAFRRRLRRQTRERANEEAFSFLLFRHSDQQLLGGLTLGQIRRGVAQSATIGYWMGQPFAGRGYMKDALSATVLHAFRELRLHRLEAACLPANHRSMALLERVGFKREGLARAYLRIAGRWQDHFLYGLLEQDARKSEEFSGY